MDFALNEEQLAISELAGQVIGDASTNERLRELEKADGPRFDEALWASLAETGILGAFLPEESHCSSSSTLGNLRPGSPRDCGVRSGEFGCRDSASGG
ncbi:MAG: hypothetical protein NTX58_14665 [Actinobacteria bacterium]|nr:hypothetical protein [Actinomycetota bacterium]